MGEPALLAPPLPRPRRPRPDPWAAAGELAALAARCSAGGTFLGVRGARRLGDGPALASNAAQSSRRRTSSWTCLIEASRVLRTVTNRIDYFFLMADAGSSDEELVLDERRTRALQLLSKALHLPSHAAAPDRSDAEAAAAEARFLSSVLELGERAQMVRSIRERLSVLAVRAGDVQISASKMPRQPETSAPQKALPPTAQRPPLPLATCLALLHSYHGGTGLRAAVRGCRGCGSRAHLGLQLSPFSPRAP